MSATDVQFNEIGDEYFGSVSPSIPATYYMALSTTTITDVGGNVTEPSGGSYARVAIANNKTNFSTSASASISNLVEFSFPESTGSWGTITYMALYEAASGGTPTWFAPLTTARLVDSGTTLTLPVSGMTISWSNS